MDVLELALWGDDSDTDPTQDDCSQLKSIGNSDDLRLRGPLDVVSEAASETRECSTPERQAGRKRPTSTLSRRREEIVRLQLASEYLERQLQQLLSRHVTSGNEWERNTVVERSQREQAELENQRLRSQLQHQNVTLAQLRQLLDVHLGRMKQRHDVVYSPLPPISVSLHDHREHLDALTQLLDTMYLQTDLIFSDPRLESSANAVSFIDVERHYDPDTLTIQLIASRYVPFDAEVTAEAEWKYYLKRSRSLSGDQYECLADGTIRSCYAMYIVFPGFQALVKAELTLRRIEEPCRVVILRSSIFTYLTRPEKIKLNGMPTARHFSWTTVSPVSGGSGCISQNCGILVPTLPMGTTEEEAEITSFYSDLCKEFREEHLNEVDNFLIRSQKTPN